MDNGLPHKHAGYQMRQWLLQAGCNVIEYFIEVRKTGTAGKEPNNSASVWREISTNDIQNVCKDFQVSLRFAWPHQLAGFLLAYDGWGRGWSGEKGWSGCGCGAIQSLVDVISLLHHHCPRAHNTCPLHLISNNAGGREAAKSTYSTLFSVPNATVCHKTSKALVQ